jgi:hypothetical protein
MLQAVLRSCGPLRPGRCLGLKARDAWLHIRLDRPCNLVAVCLRHHPDHQSSSIDSVQLEVQHRSNLSTLASSSSPGSAVKWNRQASLQFSRPDPSTGVSGCRRVDVPYVSDIKLKLATSHRRYVCLYSIVLMSSLPSAK